MKTTMLAILTIAALFPILGAAETVSTKYSGQVQLDGFSCKYTQSSFVHRACYHRDKRQLLLLLQNAYYLYCEVPAGVASGLLSASSKGSYFNAQIKGRYDC